MPAEFAARKSLYRGDRIDLCGHQVDETTHRMRIVARRFTLHHSANQRDDAGLLSLHVSEDSIHGDMIAVLDRTRAGVAILSLITRSLMAETSAPGIHIEQLTAHHHPMYGGSTGTTGFIGAGSVGSPLLGVAGFSREAGHALGSSLGSPGINRLRFIPVESQDSEWKYVNIRRLAVFIEQSLYHGTQWAVFEPNGPALWAALTSSIAGFLTSLWQSGALQGSRPDEAFFVRCDRSTMTQNDIDNGRLVAFVGFAPVRPAEFVVFSITGHTHHRHTKEP